MSFIYFLFTFFVHFPIQSAEGYQYGYKQMAVYINEHYDKYEKIIVDPRFGSKDYYHSGVPSLYIPFYTNMHPRQLQNAQMIKTFPYGVYFDKYEFREIYWDKEEVKGKFLYAVPFDNIPQESQNLKVVYEIQLPNHEPRFTLYSLK